MGAVSLLWEVRKLLMLLITPGVESVCFIQCVQTAAQMFMVLGNGRSATQQQVLEEFVVVVKSQYVSRAFCLASSKPQRS
jgi:hypothetical protein